MSCRGCCSHDTGLLFLWNLRNFCQIPAGTMQGASTPLPCWDWCYSTRFRGRLSRGQHSKKHEIFPAAFVILHETCHISIKIRFRPLFCPLRRPARQARRRRGFAAFFCPEQGACVSVFCASSLSFPARAADCPRAAGAVPSQCPGPWPAASRARQAAKRAARIFFLLAPCRGFC